MSIIVRDARPEDFAALATLDLTYDAGRVLALRRGGTAEVPAFELNWRQRSPQQVTYNTYTVDRLAGARSRVDLFAVAECDGDPCGLLMINVPAWTDAAEITDLAVGRSDRRRGAGRALVDAAIVFGRARALRAIWVEPRSDNAAAIEFYLRLGFRISGFNDRMHSNGDDADGMLTLYMYLEL